MTTPPKMKADAIAVKKSSKKDQDNKKPSKKVILKSKFKSTSTKEVSHFLAKHLK